MTDREKMLAGWIIQLIEGDDYMLDDIYAFLKEEGFVDEDGEQIYDED